MLSEEGKRMRWKTLRNDSSIRHRERSPSWELFEKQLAWEDGDDGKVGRESLSSSLWRTASFSQVRSSKIVSGCILSFRRSSWSPRAVDRWRETSISIFLHLSAACNTCRHWPPNSISFCYFSPGYYVTSVDTRTLLVSMIWTLSTQGRSTRSTSTKS